VNVAVTPGLVTADVDGERVVLGAPTIPPGIWAAVDVTSANLAQTLDHTWEEPLWPETVTTVGSPAAVAAVRRRLEGDRELLLRWRGYPGDAEIGDPWRGGPLPELPPRSRRPPDSVPKRFGTSGIRSDQSDLTDILVTAYAALN
jgi:hypothetical protein